MKELIVKANVKLDRYKDLLLKKDVVTKEALIYEHNYMREFGDLIVSLFEEKIKCIEKKKIITYCQKLINKGIKPNKADVDKMIEDTMREYYKSLNDMLKANASVKKSKIISEYTVKKIKTIYYRIAKLIHPDMNTSLKDDLKIKELWERVQVAYECNNLKDLEELEVLVNSYLESIHYKGSNIEIPDLDEKIAKLNEEIERIRSTDPYQYKYLLSDEEEIQEKKDDLRMEIEDYKNYGKELDEVIKTLNIERIIN